MESFANLRILVIGDAILDQYVEGTTGRLCREAPVPVVSVSSRRVAPGGAANVAANCRSLGAKVHFLSLIGRDAEGGLLRSALRDCGVTDELLTAHSARSTVSKLRVVADGQLLVRFDEGCTEPIDEATQQILIAKLEAFYDWADAIILSDYGNGVLVPNLIETIAHLQQKMPRILGVDSRNRLSAFHTIEATVVKPNYRELLALLPNGSPSASDRVSAIVDHADEILQFAGSRMVAVTLDHDGAVLLERCAAPYRTYATPRPESRAAGAGDTFMSALILALAAGADPPAAAEIASAAAAVVVDRSGTTVCPAIELRERLRRPGKIVLEVDELLTRLQLFRADGGKIVFTNGCFDILHRGHIAYLNEAKSLGDILVVGVNSDASVTRLRGFGNPINPLEDRLHVLAALSCIDYVVPFDADTSADLVAAIRPDLFVKGSNYARENLPEAALVEQLGGQVRILQRHGPMPAGYLLQCLRQAPAHAWATVD